MLRPLPYQSPDPRNYPFWAMQLRNQYRLVIFDAASLATPIDANGQPTPTLQIGGTWQVKPGFIGIAGALTYLSGIGIIPAMVTHQSLGQSHEHELAAIMDDLAQALGIATPYMSYAQSAPLDTMMLALVGYARTVDIPDLATNEILVVGSTSATKIAAFSAGLGYTQAKDFFFAVIGP